MEIQDVDEPHAGLDTGANWAKGRTLSATLGEVTQSNRFPAAFAASAPCSRAVTSWASRIFASLISDPSSAPRRSHSSIGSSV